MKAIALPLGALALLGTIVPPVLSMLHMMDWKMTLARLRDT